MFSPRVPDSHMDRDCCGHGGKCLCIPNTCSRKGGEVAMTAKCPCPLRQTEAQEAELWHHLPYSLPKKQDPGGMWSCQQTLGIPNIWGRVEWVVSETDQGRTAITGQGLVSKPLWNWISLKTALPSLLYVPCFAFPSLPTFHFFLEAVFRSLRANIVVV